MLSYETLLNVGDFSFSVPIESGIIKKKMHKKIPSTPLLGISQLHPASHNFHLCFEEVLRRFLHTCQQKVPPCSWHIRRTEQTVTVRILWESLPVSTKPKQNGIFFFFLNAHF